MRSRMIKMIGFYAIGWTLFLVAFSLIRGVGTTENGPIDFDLVSSLILSVPMGLIFGSVSGIIQKVIEKKFYKKASLAKLLFIKGLLMIIFLFSMVSAYYFSYKLMKGDFITFNSIAFNGYISIVIYSYWIVVDLLLTVIRHVDQMLGKGTLKRLVLGQYYMPTEKAKIFMFLDLQSSTTIAEKIGHKKYSQFIQECFQDLEVVESFKAQVYQYVGDEVILTWDLSDGLTKNNCIEAFYAFKNRLNEKSSEYMTKYGIQPKFKAGMNAGKVICTEVGSIKKEIAYHGDVINVAARIQDKCNDYNAELLISNQLLSWMPPSDKFSFQKRGTLILKGKKEQTIVYSVRKADSNVLVRSAA